MTSPAYRITVERDWRRFFDEVDFEAVAPAAQGLFLADALCRLKMNRELLAERIGVSSKGLAKWMADRSSGDFREMPRIAWKFLLEIMYLPDPIT